MGDEVGGSRSRREEPSERVALVIPDKGEGGKRGQGRKSLRL